MYNNFNEECNKRAVIITIKNKDNKCLPRAIVVAQALFRKDVNFKNIRMDTAKRV